MDCNWALCNEMLIFKKENIHGHMISDLNTSCLSVEVDMNDK